VINFLFVRPSYVNVNVSVNFTEVFVLQWWRDWLQRHYDSKTNEL